MTHRDRFRAALAGQAVDRPPLALWHHFRPNGSPEALAASTVDFFGRMDFDVYKIMPDLPYPSPPGSPLREPAAWADVPRLSAEPGGQLAGMPEAARLVRERAPAEVVLVTAFSPLALAMRYAKGASALAALCRRDGAPVRRGLEAIADNLAEQCRAALDAGADGIFFATSGQGDGMLSEDEYREIGRPYDLRVLEACTAGWCNVLHMHASKGLNWRLTADYPVQVFSWSDRRTGVPLEEVARAVPGKAVMGGLDEGGPVVAGDEPALREEMRDAARRAAGHPFILANGCSVPDGIPEDHLRLARRLVDGLGR